MSQAATRLNNEEAEELLQDGDPTEKRPQRKIVPVAARVIGEGLEPLLVAPGRLSYEPVGAFLDGAVSEIQADRKEEDPNAPDPERRDLLIPYTALKYVEFFFEEVDDEGEEDGSGEGTSD